MCLQRHWFGRLGRARGGGELDGDSGSEKDRVRDVHTAEWEEKNDRKVEERGKMGVVVGLEAGGEGNE